MTSQPDTRILWHLEHAGPWQVALVLAGAALLLFWYARGLRGGRRRPVLLLLRAGNLLLLGTLLLRPVVERQRLRPLPVRLAVLIDTSASMHWRLGRQPARLERVRDWLRRQLADLARSGDGTVELFSFAEQAESTSLEQLQLVPPGNGSDLLGALETVTKQSTGDEPLAAVVLVSDGADSATLKSVDPEGEIPDWLDARLRALGVPVNTVVVGTGERFLDLAVDDVEFDPFAFVRNSVTLTARISLVGGEPVTVPVSLSDAGRQLTAGQVTVEPGRSQKLQLRFVPDRVGKVALSVSVPVIDGDRLPGNNRRDLVIRVVRDKTRILHVVGRPSWDVRFLREHFKRDPTIDLVSFYILRTLADAPGVGEDELSLIPFPVHQLFSSELDTFDLVVLQNFNPGPYAVGLYLANLAEYVRRGGALCMVGGDLAFASGGYQGSALEDVLPVRLQTGADYQPDVFRPVLTDAGARHPLLRFAAREAWSRLPPLTAYNRAAGLAPGAVVLLEHPFVRLSEGRIPVLAVRQVGRGRSAALLSDAGWRWAFQAGGGGSSGRLYHRLWTNLVRWLIRDPDMEAIQLKAWLPRPGGKRELRVVIGGGSEPRQRVRLRLRAVGSGRVVAERPRELRAGEQQELTLPLPEPGAYRLEVVANDSERPLAREVVVVEEASVEQRHAVARPELLRLLASATGGKSSNLEQARLTAGRLTVRQHSRVESRDSRPWLASLGVVLVCVLLWVWEWWLRRSWGYA